MWVFLVFPVTPAPGTSCHHFTTHWQPQTTTCTDSHTSSRPQLPAFHTKLTATNCHLYSVTPAPGTSCQHFTPHWQPLIYTQSHQLQASAASTSHQHLQPQTGTCADCHISSRHQLPTLLFHTKPVLRRGLMWPGHSTCTYVHSCLELIIPIPACTNNH